MDIAVIGASGTIGRQITIALVQDRVLPPTSRLQLIGHRGGDGERALHGFAADLADAYAEILPEIDVAFEPDDLVADIVIIAAGAAISTDPTRLQPRTELGRSNLAMFDAYAQALKKNGHGEELVLVVSNPVELGVHVFAKHLGRNRVIGMGGYLDTMRFRQEIAAELGIRRQHVQGFVLGEHGTAMVPCWSTVSAFGFDSDEGRARLHSLHRVGAFDAQHESKLVVDALAKDGPLAAYRLAAGFSPDVRVLVKPYITHLSGARTPVGSAEMIVRLVETLVDGEQTLTAAQVVLAGEFHGIRGVTGAPVIVSNHGVTVVDSITLTDDEAARVRQAADKFEQMRRELGA
jgi:malate dehydrogenase